MHELSICENIRGIIEDQARAQGFSRVDCVTLEIGRLSGVEVEALRFGFDVAMQGSIAAQARLDIVDLPATAWCMPCGAQIEIRQRYDGCPSCGSHQLQVTGGEELRIKSLEVN
ncbi:MAG: hydrogenase maturation nickel metallochaperone HypA [Sphingobium sp.]|nr:hydrogenase maturation nickel metallochaperone HypA [Sphingobium sp.]